MKEEWKVFLEEWRLGQRMQKDDGKRRVLGSMVEIQDWREFSKNVT